MQSADRFGPLKGLCPYKALIGLTQATGLAGGFDYQRLQVLPSVELLIEIHHCIGAVYGGIDVIRCGVGR